jgi:DNA-directed RNA polymerase subunit RPC12/RpoP
MAKSKPSHLECPKCNGKLIIAEGTSGRALLVGAGRVVPRIYVCTKCGYRGQVGLEPGLIKLDKKRKI